MVYSTRRFVLCIALCYFVLDMNVFFSPFSIATTLLGEEKANISAFRTFVRFALVWFCLFSHPLRVLDGLRHVIVGLPGLFSYHFFNLHYPPIHRRLLYPQFYHPGRVLFVLILGSGQNFNMDLIY